MRHEGDAAARLALSDHAEGADELEHEPQPDGHLARHLGQHAQHDDAHAAVRVQHEVAAHHAGNRARGAQAGMYGLSPTRTSDDMRQRGERAGHR